MRIGLFVTCLTDTLYPDTGKAVVTLLERLGHQVEFPMAQSCCGQMHFNTGYQREAIPLVRRFVEVFRDAEVVVSPSASCVGMVRHLYPMAAELAEDETLAVHPDGASHPVQAGIPGDARELCPGDRAVFELA